MDDYDMKCLRAWRDVCITLRRDGPAMVRLMPLEVRQDAREWWGGCPGNGREAVEQAIEYPEENAEIAAIIKELGEGVIIAQCNHDGSPNTFGSSELREGAYESWRIIRALGPEADRDAHCYPWDADENAKWDRYAGVDFMGEIE